MEQKYFITIVLNTGSERYLYKYYIEFYLHCLILCGATELITETIFILISIQFNIAGGYSVPL